ncbi:PAS domain S-box-containing protein/diguanylate cyclase (GGDEF) domain-containing protein [Rhizobium tibeticum]|uniref:PAS domain S-box-containing protein/diguanylate cyclase (GGDEF) domain-containing protein n=1 Tax=Rhizobium tibeticum TaxID=501024 RepID=A0A1H8MT88_9HYPH|nr:diguanylate cyclase [Rhizobium tibeticum]SEI11617.1 putative diguanylate cyclase YegE [Rhizobium tibeticum]SEO20454.1 PAS domain S-box-containing protein/diguanylate cyclase (GGDEF) domain-containing protein [Rhizobium tibeticum]
MKQSGNAKPLYRESAHSAEERGALFDYAFEAAPIGVALVSPSGKIIKVNGSLATMLARARDDLTDVPFGHITHPDDLETDLNLFDDVLGGKRDGYRLDKRYLRPDNSVVEACLTVTAMRKPSGEVARLLAMIEDVTEARWIERQLLERATQLELAMEAVRGGFWHMDLQTKRFETSDRLARFIGGPHAGRMELNAYLANVHPDDHPAADLTPLLEGEVDKSVAEYRLRTTEGERWMRCDRRLLRDAQGTPFRIIGVVIDFTEEHLRRAELEVNADTDVLTGLFNRRGLQKKFDRMSKEKRRLVLTIDLDGFKEINDSLGHAAGDQVLIETASRLKAAVRPSDAVCRLGGDEFVVLLEGGGDVAERVASRIVAELAAPVDLKDGVVLVEASVGAAWTTSSTPTLEKMMRHADGCLYEAKARGKNTAVVCEIEMME